MASRRRGLLRRSDVFHSPHYTLPFFLKTPSVVTIHDIIHVTHPENFLHRLFGTWLINSAINRASRLLTVSADSRKAIEENFGVPDVPVRVIPNAVQKGMRIPTEDELEDFRYQEKLDESYMLFVGSDRPHKGFSELLNAWRTLQQQEASLARALPRLVVVGERYSKASREALDQLGARVFEKVSSIQLACLYKGAEAVVIPSRVEGFGLVLLEAMLCRTPVICTPLSCFQELAADAAWYTPGFNASAIVETISEFLGSGGLVEQKRDKAEQYTTFFTRRSTALETLNVYRELLGLAPADLTLEKSSPAEQRVGALG